MEKQGFYQLTLPLANDLFSELSTSIDFEGVTNGRVGNHLVNVSDEGIPIVRTTTKYNIPAHRFDALHRQIAESIKEAVGEQGQIQLPEVPFNNALIEVYGQEYFKMGYHSDQCLDLEADSYIALFSCYERPDELTRHHTRKLKVRSKTSEEEFEFLLENNSVVLFSLATNTQFQHKIVLEPVKGAKPDTDNKWLGITFRKSKTLIRFQDNLPHFANGGVLKLADEAQRKEFYKLRGQENKRLDFEYPAITYTISVADTLVPKTNQASNV
ncbi:hypothetical protein BKI52_39105 [marine bacterium AO1-C]|nr:hypothetical protein BKI52_39105 [marine bacterium AO1-C]